MAPRSNELLDAVRLYANRGWRVIALHHMTQIDGVDVCSCSRKGDCKAKAKHPKFGKWREVATTDITKLEAWWRAWPRANVGLLMGGLASIITVDIDGVDGRESLAQLEALHGPLPKTLTQSTGREDGGTHYIFSVDPFYLDWIKNRAKVAPGIDFRSEGGLIVAAPSVHYTGAKYLWNDLAQPIAPLPDWLFKLAISHKARSAELASSADRPNETEIEKKWKLAVRLKLAAAAVRLMPAAIAGNNGHSACLRAALTVVRGFLVPFEPHNHAIEILEQAYNPICEPAWEENELIHKVNSAVASQTIPWSYRLDALPSPEDWDEDPYYLGIKQSLFPEAIKPGAFAPETVQTLIQVKSASPAPGVVTPQAPDPEVSLEVFKRPRPPSKFAAFWKTDAPDPTGIDKPPRTRKRKQKT